MSIEDLEQLDITGQHADEIALSFSFQLGRTEPAQSGEHMIADEGQQAERDIVISVLFAIAKQTAADAGQGQQRKEHGQ